MVLNFWDSFSDPWATATDLKDGNLTSSINVAGSVDTNTPWDYRLDYSVSDSDWNIGRASRNVKVLASWSSLAKSCKEIKDAWAL